MSCDPTEVDVRVDVFIDRFGIEPSWRNALLALVRQLQWDAHKEAFASGWEAADQTQGLRYVLTFDRCWQRYCLERGLAAPQRAEERGA